MQTALKAYIDTFYDDGQIVSEAKSDIGYYKGLSKSTAGKRRAHFKRHAKMSAKDPKAYKPAPGDAQAKTTPSQYTKRYAELYGEAYLQVIGIEEKVEGLVKKSKATGVPYWILKKVYDRGMAAWRTGHRPGTNPQQWAFARVNSFLTGGKTRKTTDADLWKKVP